MSVPHMNGFAKRLIPTIPEDDLKPFECKELEDEDGFEYEDDDDDDDDDEKVESLDISKGEANDISTELSELQPKKKRQRRNTVRKYSVYCKKKEIPYPNISERELEHLDDCQICQELWPLYLYWQQYELKVAYEEVMQKWSIIRERERLLLHKKLKKDELQWKKSMIKCRPPTGYQIFLKEKRQSNEQLQKVKFGDCTRIIAKLWAALSEDQKKVYNDVSIQLKKDRVQFLDTLPTFKRKDYDSSKRKLKSVKRSNRIPKPCNAFMLYLSNYWKQEKLKNTVLKYKDIMQIASDSWFNKMSEEEKLPFRSQFLAAKEKYLIEKQKMLDEEPKKPGKEKPGKVRKGRGPGLKSLLNGRVKTDKVEVGDKSLLKKRKRSEESVVSNVE